MYRDSNSNMAAKESVRPQVAAAPVNGEGVDLRGFDSATIVVTVGAITGAAGDASVILEESDDNSVFTDVADADILGTEPTALAANSAYQFGYKGDKRYVRTVADPAGETDIAVSAMVIACHASQAPTDESGAAPIYTGT